MEPKNILAYVAKIVLPFILGGAILWWMYRGEDLSLISHVLTDVPRRGPLPHQSCVDGRDGLDMDAALVSFRYLGTDVPWLAMETDAGSHR